MKTTFALCLVIASLVCFHGTAVSGEAFPEPPAMYEDKGACPGECCVFRRWSVLQDAALVDKPEGTRVVAIVKKGEWVKGLTGTIFIAPTRLKVVHPHVSSEDPQLSYRVGDILYMLTPMGEGYRKAWFKGKMLPRGELFSHLDCTHDQESCPKPSEECWAVVEGPCHEHEMVWWVKVRTNKGVEGWFKELSGKSAPAYDDPHFGNTDSCG